MSVFTALMKGCCLECPGWVPVTLLQFMCLRFLITYSYEVLITNRLCRRASSLEASDCHFRADCVLVMVEWAVPMHTSHTNRHRSSSTVSLNTDKERNTHSSVCLRSRTLSWPFAIYFKAGRWFLAWAIAPCSAGCVHNAARHSPDPLLWDTSPPTFLSTFPHGLRDRPYFCSQAIHNYVQLYWTWPKFWEHCLFLDERHHLAPKSPSLLAVMYPEAPCRPIILCLLFQELGKIHANYLKQK